VWKEKEKERESDEGRKRKKECTLVSEWASKRDYL
jgi:hypothetical protein